MANLPSIRLENRSYVQTPTYLTLTPVVFSVDVAARDSLDDTTWRQYFSIGSFPLTNITIVKQAVFIVTAGVTFGTATSGVYTIALQYLPYKAATWITFAAHTVVGTTLDGGAIKVASCQAVRRFLQNDTIRVGVLFNSLSGTITPSNSLATGSAYPYISITRALI